MELYKKKINTDTDKEDEFEVYDAIEHLKTGIVYKAVKKNTKNAYSEIGFKLTAGRKIEIKLARSTNQILRSYYYDWSNATNGKATNGKNQIADGLDRLKESKQA